jgi:hypothetical protein
MYCRYSIVCVYRLLFIHVTHCSFVAARCYLFVSSKVRLARFPLLVCPCLSHHSNSIYFTPYISLMYYTTPHCLVNVALEIMDLATNKRPFDVSHGVLWELCWNKRVDRGETHNDALKHM